MLGILHFCCFFFLILTINGSAASTSSLSSAWHLPTAEEMEESLESCQLKAAGEDAIMLRCLVEQLGLWTDAEGYKAKRIAKIFAARNQMEELILVIEYCNNRERRVDQPAQWAFEAYKCATSGRFGRWVTDYMSEFN